MRHQLGSLDRGESGEQGVLALWLFWLILLPRKRLTTTTPAPGALGLTFMCWEGSSASCLPEALWLVEKNPTKSSETWSCGEGLLLLDCLP